MHISPATKRLVVLTAVNLALASEVAAVQETPAGLETAFSLAGESLAEPLLGIEVSYITADGTRLIIGRSSAEAKLSTFLLDGSGTPSFEQEVSVADPGFANLTSVNALTGSADSELLYAAGPGVLNILGIDAVTGSLSLLEQVGLPGNGQSIALASQGSQLVIGTSNGSGEATLLTYNLNASGRSPVLADSWEYAEDDSVSDLEISTDGARVYTSTNRSIYQHSLSAMGIIGEQTVVVEGHTTGSGSILDLSDDELRIYSAALGDSLHVFTRSSVSELFSEAQRFPTINPQVLEGNRRTVRELQLSSDGSTLYVARESFFRSSVVVASSGCLDSYRVNEQTGTLRLSGFSCSGNSGGLLSLHPQLDLIYSAAISIEQLLGSVSAGVLGVFRPIPALAETAIVSAVLPSARTDSSPFVSVSAFATVLNTGPADARVCSLRTVGASAEVASLSYQLVDPTTNSILAGSESNEEFDIPSGGAASLVFFVGNRISDVESALLEVQAVCLNSSAAPSVAGVNTLLYSASDAPLADVISSTATLERPGIVTLPDNSGLSLFTAAAVNIGDADTIEARPVLELGSLVDGLELRDDLPDVQLEICQTDPATSECLTDRSASATLLMNTNDVATFTVFITGNGLPVPFLPETNRVFIVFLDQNQKVRGGSSVALETAR